MPTPLMTKWPKPKDPREFEAMATDYLRIRWKDPGATMHGRDGQAQFGVDVVGKVQDRYVGAQCKNTDKPTLLMVQQEVEKAKGFGGLSEFLFVTSAESDGKLQRAVWQYYTANPAPFTVGIVFWPDITNELAGHDILVDKYWKQFRASTVSVRTVLVLLIAATLTVPIGCAGFIYGRQVLVGRELRRIQRVAADIDRTINEQLDDGQQENIRPDIVQLEYRDAAGTCLGKDYWDHGRLVRRVLFQPEQHERCEKVIATNSYVYQSDDPEDPRWFSATKKIVAYPDEHRRITLRDEFAATGTFKAKEHCSDGFGREGCVNGTMLEDNMRSELPPPSILVPALSVYR
jgi:hypothetical protein